MKKLLPLIEQFRRASGVHKKFKRLIFGLVLFGAFISCNLPTTEIGDSETLLPRSGDTAPGETEFFDFLPERSEGSSVIPSPTPNPMRELAPLQLEQTSYTVQINDTLGKIAIEFAVTLEALIEANKITNPNVLDVGQILVIPAPIPGAPAPGIKLIPDSELVNGPYNALFDLPAFIQEQGGLLSTHYEEVDDRMLSGTQIVELVATNYSVNPRLLLALLDYQTGWLSQSQVSLEELAYPMGNPEPSRDSLYLQLTWAADTLNAGYYQWRAGTLDYFRTADGLLIPAATEVNAGTAGLQYFFAQLYDETSWRETVSANGFIQTYQSMYSYAFDWAIEPLLPADLTQPEFQLPFEDGVSWVFTGGAHWSWDDGSAWGALDFAPPSDQLGCVSNDNWVVAVADGIIVRAADGAVVQDLDGDSTEQTGWTVLYMHIESRDRVLVGKMLHAGDRIGHPSCEGGYSTGTHLHIARKFNGEWIPIYGSTPFIMDGWTAVDTGQLYNGYLQKGDQIIEPCECKEPENMIQR
ncbi:MAG: LysM peptidoglycan-binding domain-containing protein [Chloroflexota bacterium]